MSDPIPEANRRILLVDSTDAIHRDFLSILQPTAAHGRLSEAKRAVLGEATGQRGNRIQFEVDSAMQGKQALELVRQRVGEGRPYAMIFTEMRLPPGWDGVETLQRIWQLDPHVQAVICAAHAEYSWDTLADQLSASDQFLFLRKPFDNCEIRQLAIALTQKWCHEAASRKLIAELQDAARQRTEAVDSDRDSLIRTNQQLERARASAEDASTSKSAFLANMSHEIRTPLTAILGYADFLLDEGEICEAPPQRVVAINTIRRNGVHLMKLLNDILDISKIEARKLTMESVVCSPVELTDDVINLMRDRAHAKQLTLERKIVGELPVRIQTDPMRLRQVLVNLVGNAIKFTNVGGITLTLQMRDAAEAPQLEFAVTDTGIGIDAHDIGRLFEPFNQGSNVSIGRHGGTGLGLSICRRLSEMLGGSVTVDSTPGVGSTFRFTIATGPVANVPMIGHLERDDTPQRGADDAASGRNCQIGGRILLAEDGPDNQRLFVHLLKKAGAEVTVVGDGEQACQSIVAAEEAGMPIDVVLMDVQMPVLDGYDAVRRLRQLGFELPIIALTAHAMKGSRQSCLEAGFTDYLPKPIERNSFLGLVSRYAAAAK